MKALFGPTTAVNEYQRTVHWFFVLIFSLILPFICFGMLATPGHPHSAAHFVFAVPPQANIPSDTQISAAQLRSFVLASWCGTPLDTERTDVILTALTAVDIDSDSTSVGQSVPSTLLSMLLLLFISAWLMHRIEIPDFAIWVPNDSHRVVDLPVPTPPPRLSI